MAALAEKLKFWISLKLNLGYYSVSNYQFAKLIGQISVNKWPVLWKCCKDKHLAPGEWRDGIIVVDRCIATPNSDLVHQNAVFFYKPFWAECNRIDSDFGDLFCDVGHTLLIPRVCWVFDEKRSSIVKASISAKDDAAASWVKRMWTYVIHRIYNNQRWSTFATLGTVLVVEHHIIITTTFVKFQLWCECKFIQFQCVTLLCSFQMAPLVTVI